MHGVANYSLIARSLMNDSCVKPHKNHGWWIEKSFCLLIRDSFAILKLLHGLGFLVECLKNNVGRQVRPLQRPQSAGGGSKTNRGQLFLRRRKDQVRLHVCRAAWEWLDGPE